MRWLSKGGLVSELMRQALDEYLVRHGVETTDPKKKAARKRGVCAGEP